MSEEKSQVSLGQGNGDASTVRESDYVDAVGTASPPSQDDTDRGNKSALMSVEKTAARYNMKHPQRGICLVFNHEDFEDPSDKREGTGIDVAQIRDTFANKLRFDVVVRDNFTCGEIITEIGKLRKEDHAKNDCVCIFVLTHGKGADELCAKDLPYSSKMIWEPFTADKCLSLAGKPKLFFFQTCRGGYANRGVELELKSDNHTDAVDAKLASYTIPTDADFLIAHSCTEGSVAFRNSKTGTPYVQTLCKVLEEHWGSTDLLRMLTITARLVATDYKSLEEAHKQMPTVLSTLIRDLYFEPESAPDLHDSSSRLSKIWGCELM